MSDFYTVPAPVFDAKASERVRKQEANATAITIIKAWKSGYERFWQTPRTHQERALSRDDMQATLDLDKAGFGEILTESAGFRDFIVASYPAHVGSPIRDEQDPNYMSEEDDEAKMLPSRYLITPYPMDASLNLTGDIVPEWDIQT